MSRCNVVDQAHHPPHKPEADKQTAMNPEQAAHENFGLEPLPDLHHMQHSDRYRLTVTDLAGPVVVLCWHMGNAGSLS